MEFACSVCQYTSNNKENTTRHINRKKSCGVGIKKIIEIPIEIKCEYCSKDFSCVRSFRHHKKNTCRQKDKILEEENRRLKEENRKLKEDKTKNVTINNTYNIYIANYENTNLDKITDKIYNNIINDSETYQIIPRLIKEVHFNSDIPENHNIYISNRGKNNKHLSIYRNNHWEIENKATEIDNLIYDKETNISDWIGEKGEKYPEASEKFNEYLEQKYDEDTLKLIKDEVEKVLYNNRYMIKT